MALLHDEIAAYNSMAASLEASHIGKWALVYDGELIDIFSKFDDAARVAVDRFGRGPYLIRQVGNQSVHLPTSVMYRDLYEDHSGRL